MRSVSATIGASPAPRRANDEAGDPAVIARLSGGAMRDLRSARTESGARTDDDEVREFRLGWTASLLLNLVLLGAPLGLVIALPPVLECREREAHFGFFAGETLTTCSTRGIGQRLKKLDDRITMLVRGSGR